MDAVDYNLRNLWDKPAGRELTPEEHAPITKKQAQERVFKNKREIIIKKLEAAEKYAESLKKQTGSEKTSPAVLEVFAELMRLHNEYGVPLVDKKFELIQGERVRNDNRKKGNRSYQVF